jgi:hypothetical protein
MHCPHRGQFFESGRAVRELRFFQTKVGGSECTFKVLFGLSFTAEQMDDSLHRVKLAHPEALLVRFLD